mmetsp:Transcript_87449/g.155099  ORF Transcript_87449/g.155099 Transcript_87449/m.155099 type:complete len:237 (-) Transcript_87449:166-876(-)
MDCRKIRFVLPLLSVGAAILWKTLNPAATATHTHTVTVPEFGTRDSLGSLLEAEGMRTGAELGVQAGLFSKATLAQWPSCKSYMLVDVWAQLTNYEDTANVNNSRQEELYQMSLRNTDPWKENVHVCRNYTTNCAKRVADHSLDYVYLDARHDYKGVLVDLHDWWPKVRLGGIMAGHDFNNAAFAAKPGQDWTLNYDGTRDPEGRAVKGAVEEFAKQMSRTITVGTDDKPSWAIRK